MERREMVMKKPKPEVQKAIMALPGKERVMVRPVRQAMPKEMLLGTTPIPPQVKLETMETTL